MAPRLFLVTGCCGSGKTTLSRALLQRFPLGFHLAVDDIREMVASGRTDPNREWTDAMQLQYDTAREASAELARVYLKNGFTVVIDDLMPQPASEFMLKRIGHEHPTRILLMPPVETCVERNQTRTNKTFGEDMKQELGEWIPGLYQGVIDGYGGRSEWMQLDSRRTVEELVDEILKYSNLLKSSS